MLIDCSSSEENNYNMKLKKIIYKIIVYRNRLNLTLVDFFLSRNKMYIFVLFYIL
jgi:hypothetical protein